MAFTFGSGTSPSPEILSARNESVLSGNLAMRAAGVAARIESALRRCAVIMVSGGARAEDTALPEVLVPELLISEMRARMINAMMPRDVHRQPRPIDDAMIRSSG